MFKSHLDTYSSLKAVGQPSNPTSGCVCFGGGESFFSYAKQKDTKVTVQLNRHYIWY